MCVQLNLEDSVDEIMMQLGVDKTGQISFQVMFTFVFSALTLKFYVQYFG